MPNARVPAASGGLPSRRAALATLAGAGAVLSLPVAMSAAGEHPDAHLLALFAEWQVSAADADRTAAAFFEAQGRLQCPDPPKALFRRGTDFHFFIGWWGSQREDGRWWYGCPTSLSYLRDLDCGLSEQAPAEFPAAFAARRDEILTAHAAWQEEIAAAKRACGMSAAEEDDGRENKRNRALRRAIALAPAATVTGLLIKLRVAHWCCDDWASSVERRVAANDLTDETMLASAMADLVALESRHGSMPG